MDALISLLKAHDWYFEYSDSLQVYKSAVFEINQIKSVSKSLQIDNETLKKLINDNKPANLSVDFNLYLNKGE